MHVHHTVSLNDYTAAEAPAVVLAICRYHRNSNGWNDVGYNMLVDRFGVLYEGRAGGLDKAVVGAQAQGFNAQTSGIASIGDNRTVELGPEALSALATWIRWKLTVHGQPLSGKVTLTSAGGSLTKYPTGARVSVQRVIGHRDTGLTECPGGALYAQLPELRALVESGSAPPVDTFATRLSAALDVDSALFGQPVVVGGTLLSGAGAVLAGESLEIQVSTENAWRTVGHATTGPDGVFSDELQPRKRMYLRVRFPGRSGLRRSTSDRLLLRLHPTIEFDEPPTRARRGRAVSLAGSVAPRKRALRLVVQRRERGRWRKAGARTVRVRRGSFVTSFTPDRRGTWRFYAVAPPDLDTDRGASERHVLRGALARLPALAQVVAVEAVPRGEHARRARQDPDVEPQRAVLDVPDVELDPLRPRQRGAAVDLGPARDAGLHVEPAALALGVTVDLLLDRRARAHDRELSAQHVDQVRQLVEREAPQQAAAARDARVALEHVDAGAHRSAPGTIVRSFQSSNGCPPLPTRRCR